MREFPRPRTYVQEMQALIEAWAATAFLHKWSKGADDDTIERAEEELGRVLPDAFRAIYEMSDGLSLLQGDVQFYSLFSDREECFGVADFAEGVQAAYKDPDFTFPDELVVFAKNSAEDEYGLWLPREADFGYVAPVVEIGEGGYEDMLAVAGSDICRFLTIETAYQLISTAKVASNAAEKGRDFKGIKPGGFDFGAVDRALDILQLPTHIRQMDPLDPSLAVFDAICAWADPDLPYAEPDPYDSQFTAAKLRMTYGESL